MDYLRGAVFPVAKVLVDSYRTTSSEIIGSVVLYLCSTIASAGGVGKILVHVRFDIMIRDLHILETTAIFWSCSNSVNDAYLLF
jgi:hypothetical protein